jgi:hypothetical protein
MNKEKPNIIKVVGLAVGLPSSILGVFALVYFLIHKDYLSTEFGLVLILTIIFYTFYLMIRYANKK